jgi:hypothetical protein
MFLLMIQVRRVAEIADTAAAGGVSAATAAGTLEGQLLLLSVATHCHTW